MTRGPVLSPPVLPARPPEISAAAMADALEGLRSRAEVTPPVVEERRSLPGRLGWAVALLVVSGGLAVPLRHVLFEAPSAAPPRAASAAVEAAPSQPSVPLLARREADAMAPSIGPGAAMAAEPAAAPEPPAPVLARRDPEPVPQASAPPALPMPLDLQLPPPPVVEVTGLADAPVVERVAEAERVPAAGAAVGEAMAPSAPVVAANVTVATDMPPMPMAAVAMTAQSAAMPAPAVADAPRVRIDIEETATLSLQPSSSDADPRRMRTAALNVPSVASEAPSAVPSPPAPLPGVARGAPAPGNMDVEWLLARAQGLIREGDISGARLLLERAHAGGSRRAAFHLAETYDPRRLADWRALGIRGDPARARALYLQAKDGGIAEAGDRLLGLR